MPGGSRLLWIVACLSLMAAVAWAADDTAPSTSPSAGPPKAKVDVVEETIHGHKIADPYRWLEDASSADSQEYVRAEMAYTRSLLDPLPGRDRIHERLSQLLAIGTIGTPQVAGPYFFYIRREGAQNQPVLLVREGLHGKDRRWWMRTRCPPMARSRSTGGSHLTTASTWLMEPPAAALRTAPST